ncbi:pre-toxin TG domain-containing protein [Bacillus cereus]|uniref:pre-toxin TG domain-containing protein n=1 Tax=Bacillus thuringiensis TaxID=1428 RepID=UPI000CD91CA3|nr:pre-toxin TG domain-containing protein [Bacillus thuringiensis]MEB8583173.1 pre-toxin TG domain-containing protein [Bacillus cereus]MEB8596394.1 pre-toxin TG domain-containing protein [Bacillus cereus]MEB8614143.1 pre-toxin TG domain-containing protein [Bacillus cereus]MEB8616715.1 pre-toxin TG domain-containing protein [Bacillus cereus]MEB8623355.1 pre-toxin TG domain-containing protein [Bacillus cereus]
MGLNMYLGEVQAQTESMNAFCVATIQGMEQVINSIDAFVGDTILQGKTYDTGKTFFAQTFHPLAQGIIYLFEELIRQNNSFPNDFQSQVATTDVIEQEIREQIREIDRMKADIEGTSITLPGMQVMVGIYDTMKQKLQEKLEHLYEFNYVSSSNFDTALQLATSIAQGLAEVQSGKGFSPASGTFSIQDLNMNWTASIQKITEEKARESDKIVYSDLNQEETINNETSLASGKKEFDGNKLARDITGEISGEYDVRRAWEGVDPSTGEKLGTFDRVIAGGMAVAGITPIGKLVKIGKGVKMSASAVKTVKGAESNYVLFNKTHIQSMPKPKGRGPNGGKLQSHHGLQGKWAEANLSQYGYDPKLAPTVTIETGKGLPHTIITNAQNLRRDERVALGNGKWSSSLQAELKNIVSDFEKAGFSKETIRGTLEQQYRMLDKLKVKYERIEY